MANNTPGIINYIKLEVPEIRICRWCNKEFETIWPRAWFCSKQCNGKRPKEHYKEYYDKNISHMRYRARVRYQKLKAEGKLKWQQKPAKDPKRIRSKDLWKNHKITIKQYDTMFSSQNGVCGLCEKAESYTRYGKIPALSVDHDHDCCPIRACRKCIRGLLCRNCNLAIGLLGDNPDLLRKAAYYIEYFRKLRLEADVE